MLLHIALVSLTTEVTLARLAPVSAAIQKQISRDFGPMWNVEATVDAFDKLEDVPVGYWHVLLQDELPNGAAGLHKRDDNKQPFALVALTTNWTVFMSHEVLEMLVDPQGTLTRAGNSLKSGQGRVEYLIEVCDPCQSSCFAYSVNSVMVSDFYTPQYFDPAKSAAVRYSFSGQVRGPREVLDVDTCRDSIHRPATCSNSRSTERNRPSPTRARSLSKSKVYARFPTASRPTGAIR